LTGVAEKQRLFAGGQENFSTARPQNARLKLVLTCEPARSRQEWVGRTPARWPTARSGTTPRDLEAGTMGYFALTTIFTLQYLGYVPIPTGVLVAACVGYVLYDTFKR
jgi:hypothetical protein